MAETAVAEVPTTGESAAPVAAPETTVSPQVETTDGGQATEAGAVVAEPQTPAPEAEVVPDLKELLKNPRFKAQYEGDTGERIRRARLETEAAVEQRRQQEETQRFQINEQQLVTQENQLRAAEAGEIRRLTLAGEPFDLHAYQEKVLARQDQWNTWWNQSQGQRQAMAQIQQQIGNAALAERGKTVKALEAHFRQLPEPVQKELARKDYVGGTDEEVWAEVLRDRQDALVRHQATQHQSEIDTKVQAEVRKTLARMNLSADDFDLGGGTPVSGETYRYAEEWEAAFAADKITEAEALRLRARNLPRRRNY